MIAQKIPEQVVPNKPLGRHIEHDPRSKNFPAKVDLGADLQPVLHHRHGRAFNQGDLGSCTGNACAGTINTEPLFKTRVQRVLYEKAAIGLYELATTLDEFDGAYPPEDTGSSGLAVAKAAQQKGYITAYHHAFGITQALAALQLTPLITGVNWYEGFDSPDSKGHVKLSGQIRGGHEFEVAGFDPATQLLACWQSWGYHWGDRGRFYMTVADWDRLLNEQGDVTVLLP